MTDKKEELTVKQKIAMFSANKASKPIAPGQTKEIKVANGPLPVETHKHSYTPIPSPQPALRENAKYQPSATQNRQRSPITQVAPPTPPAEIASKPEPVESETKMASIGDGVSLWTENVKGPSTIYKYTVESSILKKILFTFNFDGSENFKLSPDSVLQTPLEARVVINPFEKSETITCQQIDATKGGSLKMSMSWTLSNPDPESVIKYVNKYEKELAEDLDNARSLFGGNQLSESEIIDLCQTHDTGFFDMSFPPIFDSLSKIEGAEVDSSARRTIVWRRPAQYLSQGVLPEIYGSAIEPKDVKQGYLSDFYFTTALAIIAERPALIRKLFDGLNTPEANARGIYQVMFCIAGMWVTTMVDDFFPCLPQGTPVYSRNVGNKLWVLLLEKAYAKLHGSYKAIKVGWSIDALANLTGAPQKDYRMSELALMNDEERGALWNYFRKCQEEKYLLSCSACNTAKGNKDKELAKLRPGHSYCLLQIVTTSEGHRLAKFRSPWNVVEWNGNWSNSSPLWTDAIKAEVGFQSGEDDTFWICFDDFADQFVSINVCFITDSSNQWCELREPLEFIFRKDRRGLESVPMYELEVTSDEPVELFASIHQADKRGVESSRYLDIGLCIMRRLDDGACEYLASTGNSITRQNQLSAASLPRGTYIIIPSTACCKMEQRKLKLRQAGREITSEDLTVSTALVVHSSAEVRINKIPYDEELCQQAAEVAIAKDGTVTDLFGDSSVTLFTRKSPGNMGICYAAKNNRESGAVCFTLDVSDSDNIISDKGVLMAECPIPAGRTKLILHVAPADDEYSWTCGLFCKARTVTEQEMEQLLEAEAAL